MKQRFLGRRSSISSTQRLSAAACFSWIVAAPLALQGQSGATPDRTVLPIPKTPYTNTAGVTYKDSAPQKHAPIGAPAGAPNVLVILLDDAGYGQSSTFGGLIPTPTLDRLAAGGLRYTRFHVTALCSPSRAALLTGRNHHSVGMGSLSNYGRGFEGYDGDIPKSAAFISETLRLNGYETAALGKWHVVPDWEASLAGPLDHWPTHQGFDYYYGFLGGQSEQWHPNLYENDNPTTMAVPPGRESDYILNESLADKAIAWIDREKSLAPNRPFFIYYAPGATHSPLQAPKAWIDQFKGKFDMGWDRYREIVFERQKKLGVIPADTKLTPRPAEIPAWDSLSPDQQKVDARLMEVFAGMMAQADHEIGRVIDEIEATGQLDNTLIFYIAGDNGASLEGGLNGTFNLMADINGIHETTAQMLTHMDAYGGPVSSPHYPVGWGWAGNTPFQWGKQVASHLGGTRDPLVVYWPAGIHNPGGVREQFHHLIDIAPTILEAAHLPQPVIVDGAVQQPIEGTSMLYTFNDAAAPDRHTTQYFEIRGNRAFYQDGWIAAARSGKLAWTRSNDLDLEQQPWELYHLATDYSEANDLAAANPDKVKAMQASFMAAAKKYHVLPLDSRTEELASPTNRPNQNEGRTVFTYYPGRIELLDSNSPQTLNRSYTITAYIEMPAQGGDGALVAQGGMFCGYSLYLKDRRPTYTYNYCGQGLTTLTAKDPLPAGPATIQLRFDYKGAGLGGAATAALVVNGRKAAEAQLPHTLAVSYSYHETFDIGEDSGTPVGDYPSPFRFAGKLHKVVIDLSPGQLSGAAGNTLSERRTAADAAAQ